MSKRRFLKTASSLGIASAALQYASQEAVAKEADHDDEVVYADYIKYKGGTGPDRPPEKEAVLTSMPRDLWSRNEAAYNLSLDINRRIDELWDDDCLMGGITTMDDSPHEYGVIVSYEVTHTADGTLSPDPSIETVRDRLPDKGSAKAGEGKHERHFDDIPVHVVKQEAEQTYSNSPEYSNIPGAARHQVNNKQGTVMAAFYENNFYNAKGWIVSGHVADQGGGEGATFSQPSSGDDGTVRQIVGTGSSIDYAWVEADDSEGVRRSLRQASDAYNFNDVVGIVPDSTIKNETGTSTTYWIRGVFDDEESGTIGAFYENSSDDPDQRFNHSTDVRDGSSGGPLFKYDGGNSDACVAGLLDKDLYLGGCAGNTAEAVRNGVPGYFLT